MRRYRTRPFARARSCGPRGEPRVGQARSGLYIAHPDAYYFGVAKVERDQVEDYAARKGMAIEDVERWLAPVLNYAPTAYTEAAE